MRKSIYKKPTANIIFNGKRQNAFPTISEQGQDIHSHHSYSIFYWKPEPVSKGMTKKPQKLKKTKNHRDCQERNKINSIQRQHDCLYGKP